MNDSNDKTDLYRMIEIIMWRKKYLCEEMFDESQEAREYFLRLPSSYFNDHDFEQAKDFCIFYSEEQNRLRKDQLNNSI